MTENATLDEHRRPNRFDIDLGAIAIFTRNIRRLAGPGVKIFAALKCNAYGFGLLPVAHAIAAAGGDAFSVVDRADAIALRDGGITAPILLYPGSLATQAAVQACERYDLIPSLIDLKIGCNLVTLCNEADEGRGQGRCWPGAPGVSG